MDSNYVLGLSSESFWFDKSRYTSAEADYYCSLNSKSVSVTVSGDNDNSCSSGKEQKSKSKCLSKSHSNSVCVTSAEVNTEQTNNSIVSDIVRARQLIKLTLDSTTPVNVVKQENESLNDLLNKLKQENQTLLKTVNDLQSIVSKLDARVSSLEGVGKQTKLEQNAPNSKQKVNAKPNNIDIATNGDKNDGNDDDLDLFGSDEDEEANETRNKRLEEYAAKKAKKGGVIAKSSVVLDVKPWDDETDMQLMEKQVRSIEMDGLLWGASKLVPLAYGIKKLQIMTVIEDEKVSVEELTEKIEGLEDLVQSVDIAAFNKI